MPVVVESTFLQLFLRNLGGSNFLIGLIPTILFIGSSLFSLLGGFLTSHLERKRRAVIATHLAAAVPLLIFGIFLYLVGNGRQIIPIFLTAYSLFSIAVGMILPVWQNYLVKIFSEGKVISALSIMMIAQSSAKLLSSLLLIQIVRRYSFSAAGSGLIFTLVGLCFILGSFMFLITREHPEKKSGYSSSSRLFGFLADLKAIFKNKKFLRFLAADLEFFAIIGIVSFYANYATEYCGISPAIAAGLFVALNHLGSLIVNTFLGWIGLLNLRNKYLVSKITSLMAVGLLFLSGSLWSFLLASFLLGASRAIRMLIYAPAIKSFSGRADATNYFALAPVLTLPVSSGIPLLNGKFLDHFAYLGAYSYRLMFLGMGALILLSLYFLLTLDFSKTFNRPEKG